MTLLASDISFVLSGGSTNTNPALSLGGDPSSTLVTSTLLSDIDEEQTNDGLTDYRCIYMANDSNTDNLYNLRAYTDEVVEGGVPVQLGFHFQNDVQNVSISQGTDVTSGSFTLQYEGTNFTVNYNASISVWADNFQTAIRAITNLEEVTVSGGTSGTTVIFVVQFVGTAGNRYHPALQVVSDSGLSIGGGHVSVLKVFDGAPINSITVEIDVVTTPPNSIDFGTYTFANKISLGDLRATDVVPIWFKRICPAGQDPLANDGFSLKIAGNPFPS